MKIISTFVLSLICLQLYAYNKNDEIEPENNPGNITNTDTMKLKITIGTKIFTATFYDNPTTNAFKANLPMTINMSELNGNEKYFTLSKNLPGHASNPKTIQTGDLMMYGSNTLVLFYKTFSTSYSYTRLGHIDNSSGLAAAVGSGSVTITFEVGEN